MGIQLNPQDFRKIN
uniref:Uncharacterized protein n=1 Tax=Arundo donax TaxID=35708 RepID=A0A0A9A5C6_ARUDO